MSISIRPIMPRVRYSCTTPRRSLGRQSPWRSLHVAVRAQSRAKTGRSRGECSSVYDSEKTISYPIRYQERLSVRRGKEQQSATPLAVYCRCRIMHHPCRCSPCAATSVRWTIWLRSHRPLQRPSPINLSRPGRPSFDLPFDASTPSHTGSPDSV